ncbi:UBE2J1 (predicted) [Pycnogonum litorale]
MQSQYSMRSPAVKRLMREMAELRDATEDYYAQPIDENLFEWHFSVRGPKDSEFEEGVYHGRIILPPEYPMKPPSIILLTPNGRFELNKKICLSISGYHPESWQPSWSIRTALLAIIGFMPTHGNGAIGSLDYTSDERKMLAKKSLDWKCLKCGECLTLLKPRTNGTSESEAAKEAKELASQISFKGEEQKKSEPLKETQAASTSEEKVCESQPVDQSNATTNGDDQTDQSTTASEIRRRIPSNTTPVPAPILMTNNVDSGQNGRESIVAIVILSVAIAVLLLRRVMLSYFQTIV